MLQGLTPGAEFPVTFFAEGHRYVHDSGRTLLSVTKVLKELSGFIGDGGSPAADFGTEVHREVAATLSKKKLLAVDKRIVPYIKAAKAFVKKEKLTRYTVAAEVLGYHPLLEYTGTLDCIFISPDGSKTVLVDWKTGIFREYYRIQLAAYSMLFEGIPAPSSCYCVMLKRDGTHEAVPVKLGSSLERDFITELSHINLMKKHGRYEEQ